ncbi:Trifunctional nucleotide phosphoesterase protein YfkN [Paragonimus heterotremus]|uniref:Trifunctional nucleotide phosphoesterase protein YfkN n=1 Tax=Paragonimus heterotremus TaxID=100268 RepID=A0A8J4WRC4_9TREM|nr:Trifunctional nucleotide phosphoesterase protein YfkN [Paragonimus heterotremus]
MGNTVTAHSTSGFLQLHILHFNDVYNVEEPTRNSSGGVARFAGALAELKARAPEQTMVLFSGNMLGSSKLSMITEGSHMIEVCNSFGIDCCVIGNHDFDFGADNLMDCVKQSNFPWLNGNCYDAGMVGLLCGLPPCHVIEKAGVKIGLIGLVESDWIDTLSVIDQGEVIVKDFCTEGRRLANELRRNCECSVIIALTHMRWANDLRLAREVPEIDLILGGHDRNSGFQTVKSVDGTDRWVIKSGSDFRQLSWVHLIINRETRRLRTLTVDVEYIDNRWTPQPEVATIVERFSGMFNEHLQRGIGMTEIPLDGQFVKIRKRETNLGNFFADIALTSVNADCAILNSGLFQMDGVVPVGAFTLQHLYQILPILTPIVVLEVTGADLIKILENGVSQVPQLDARFPQVSKITFAFHEDRPKGHFVDRSSIYIDGKPLVRERCYWLATTHSMAKGEGGYTMLLNKRHILNSERGVPLSTSVINYFRSIDVLNGLKRTNTKHRQRLMTMQSKQGLNQIMLALLKERPAKGQSEVTTNPSAQAAAVWAHTVQSNLSQCILDKITVTDEKSSTVHWSKLRKAISEEEKEQCTVAPKLERRIARLFQHDSVSL